MEYINTDQGLRLLGQGQAVIIAVKTGDVDVHEVKINHPDFGETHFIPYIQTAGVLKVPAIGDVVYVFCNEGFHTYPMAWGNKLHDSAVKALLGSARNNATVIYSTGVDNKTISHTIILDDGENRGIRVKTAGGNNIEIKNTEDIILTQINGNTVTMNEAGIELKRGGSTVTMAPDAITIKSGTITLDTNASKMIINQTINARAGDDKATVDKVVISTHDQISGNGGYQTTNGPTKTGAAI